ncbi:hypothetical protein INT45_006817 [Circinella minor]|uniref:Uncharacterized protein n=1 Tax=Circinella minor TaxID=1195481 RepID=A0A8H7VCP9_9FUNG|nr:hypothetical protein INT45_006817 [Circinella minor]
MHIDQGLPDIWTFTKTFADHQKTLKHRNCCGAKSISMQNSSFFGGKKVPLHKIMMVIYFFLASGFNGTNKQIIESTKLAPNTVTSIIDDIYLLMEGDLKLEDMTIDNSSTTEEENAIEPEPSSPSSSSSSSESDDDDYQNTTSHQQQKRRRNH